ncbi:hypothetical protein PILCRDRAFT_328093 [Piloderma croceum F 1598]|uniref:RING-type domain-containing protein n=1 Tax=Piloderma croceum (strain F 1598) TaxID=765440 RepID=A0A0C3FQT4_PILCF|nr:hypothetical protein PILCRDRAFT_328093 [Piloderma croceum F 1598]
MSSENTHNNVDARGGSFYHVLGNQYNVNINVRAGIQCIQGAASQVKDNREGLFNVSYRLDHLLRALEINRQHNLIRSDDYTDALTTISILVERAQRVTQRQLKRSLGDFTWNRDEIAAELQRMSDDLDEYLPMHTVHKVDMNNVMSDRPCTSPTLMLEELMVKLAEIELRLDLPAGADWSPSISSRARHNLKLNGHAEEYSSRYGTTSSANGMHSIDQGSQRLLGQVGTLVDAGRTSVTVRYLCRSQLEDDENVVLENIKTNATLQEIQRAISSKGYDIPTLMEASMLVTVTEQETEFDATAPGGLKIEKSMPLIWWWNKYNTYHGLAPSTTPGHTIATLESNGHAIMTSGIEIQFHRTLRVPDSEEKNRLPLDLGTIPLVPVSKFAHRLPENITKRGGFLMPMYQREALWISFKNPRKKKKTSSISFRSLMGIPPASEYRPAIKVSVGSVNIITGTPRNTNTPPSNEQDYIVAGLQPWLDGIMTEPGVVRQFVAIEHGKNFTVEEQVTGKAEHGGLQFDIFPRCCEPPHGGSFYEYNMDVDDSRDFSARAHASRQLASDMTPDEAGVSVGNTIGVFPRTFDGLDENWTLSSYQRRICGSSVYIRSMYDSHPLGRGFGFPGGSRGSMGKRLQSNDLPLGLATGGKIAQRIYQDPVSARMYDRENGHRFHVHILSPEDWELVTGFLPPISPITENTYKANKIPWYSVFDDHIPSLDKASEVLQGVKSSPTVSIFRPCSHTACDTCLGQALRKRSECPQCGATVIRFVGMKEPILNVTECTASESEQEAWNITGIEHLARQAAESNNVTVIHLEGDKVNGPHGKWDVKGKRDVEGPRDAKGPLDAEGSRDVKGKGRSIF